MLRSQFTTFKKEGAKLEMQLSFIYSVDSASQLETDPAMALAHVTTHELIRYEIDSQYWLLLQDALFSSRSASNPHQK
jgi:hypothetical protein